MTGGCPAGQRLTAYADDALGERDRRRTATHLVVCAGCRERLHDLRRLRDLVRDARGDAAAPSHDLAARLVGIAGADAATPLYARPFDQPTAPRSRMPRPRRALRRAAVATGAGSAAMGLGLVALGWVAAPPSHARAVDPGPVALSEFTTALGTEPLANPALAGAMASGAPAAEATAYVPEVPANMTGESAYARLDRAQDASDTVAYTGTQRVQLRHLAGFWTSRVDVAARPGTGAEVTVPVGQGVRARRAFVPEETPLGVEVLAANHALITGDGPVVAGRPTHVVEADRGGRATARWWLDRETGVVLWSQTLEDGRTVRSAGFERVVVGSGAGSHLAPRLAPPLPATSLTINAAPQLVQAGFTCAPRVGGLDLVRVRTVGGVLHTAYGNGVDTLSVLETRGALTGAPRGTVWDPALRAYRSQGLPTMITWQSGDRVFTVVTDAGPARAAGAVRDLPHDPPVLRTRTDRVVDGWRHVLSEMGVR